MERTKYLKIGLFILIILGMTLRLFPVRTGYHYWDETVYLQHGEIIAGESPDNYNEFDFRPPAFSLMLGALFHIFDSSVSAQIFVAVISTLGIFLTYLLGKRLFNPEIGVSAAAIYAFSPLMIRISHEILVDPILPVFWILTGLFLQKALENKRKIYYGLTGGAAALAVLTKFTSLVLVPALGLLILLKRIEIDNWGELFKTRFYISLASDRNIWWLAAGFALVVAPYLAWSQLTYGSPLHVFVRAIELSGARDPFLTYVKGGFSMLLPPFYLGLLLYFRRENLRQINYLTPVVLALSLLIPAQFWLQNKELRFLTPIIPFAAIMSAKGLSCLEFEFRNRKIGILAITALFVIISAPAGVSDLNQRNPLDKGLTSESWDPEITEAADWLRSETDSNAVVYTNYRYPPLGYYSKRQIRLISSQEPLNKSEIQPGGYIYYSEKSPFDYPELARLEQDPDFQLKAGFGQTVYVFQYNPPE